MNVQRTQFFATFFSQEKFERLKIILLSCSFLLVIAAYTMIYDLKNSIFMTIVGKEYVPWAKTASMIMLIPAVLFYSFLVDKLRRYQLLYFYSFFYSVFGIISAYFIGHSTIGLLNTDSSPWRLFGWIFYFFVEGFSPFMVNVFWAFANSVSSPKGAKDNYGLLVSGSKIGGILSAGFSWWLLTLKDLSGHRIFSDVQNHQILLYVFSFIVLLTPIIIYFLMVKVPGKYLHGYEAVYQFEKEKKKEQEEEPERVGLFSGLTMMIKQPYILGIFGMLFFYEVLNTILGYQRLGVAQSVANSVSDVSQELYRQMFFMHAIGFFISIFGTRTLLHRLGERACLILIPLVSGLLLFYFWLAYTPTALLLVFVCLKSVNYAFAAPVRESLYIPTIKDIKFKSKSWIDAFGQKFARSFGSTFNILSDHLITPVAQLIFQGSMFSFVIGGWFLTAFILGKRYAKAIKNNEIIGG